MLQTAAGGFGALAFASIFADLARAGAPATDPLAPRAPHFPAKAKNVIFLYATGGVSHVDTFDYKPALYASAGKTFGVGAQSSQNGKTLYLKRPHWGFKQYGRSGIHIADIFPNLGKCADDLCVIRSMFSESLGHDKATLCAHTGSITVARPSMGSWVSYGLGTENRNLPSFVVLNQGLPYEGPANWGSDFLPGCHQGTQVTPGPTPIAGVRPQTADPSLQSMELSLRARLNRRHADGRGADAALEARIRSFETAFGMQRQVPEAFDCASESDETLALYGLPRGVNTGFAWQCLAARRLVERGVRFVEVIDCPSTNNWDSHGTMDDHARLAGIVDRPLAALVQDLKRKGLLDSTLVVWTTEFGRTPAIVNPDGRGREHHGACYSTWLAGAGVKKGHVYGATDDVGATIAEGRVGVHDLHATILHLLGLNHEKLTFRHAGRDFRLTDVEGNVVRDILA
jgi:hypothetical protein